MTDHPSTDEPVKPTCNCRLPYTCGVCRNRLFAKKEEPVKPMSEALTAGEIEYLFTLTVCGCDDTQPDACIYDHARKRCPRPVVDNIGADWLVDHYFAILATIDALRSQLPDGMQHCTIRFRECAKGHGWLTADNWAQHDCPTCERDALRSQVSQLEMEIARTDWKLAAEVAARDIAASEQTIREQAAELQRLRERISDAALRELRDELVGAVSACDCGCADFQVLGILRDHFTEEKKQP